MTAIATMSDDEWLTIAGFLDIYTLSKSIPYIREVCHLYQQQSSILWSWLIQRDFTHEQIQSVTHTTLFKRLYKELYVLFISQMPYIYPPSVTQSQILKNSAFLNTQIAIVSTDSYLSQILRDMIIKGEWWNVVRYDPSLSSQELILCSQLDCNVIQRRIEISALSKLIHGAPNIRTYCSRSQFFFCPYYAMETNDNRVTFDGLDIALIRAQSAKTRYPTLTIFLIAIHFGKHTISNTDHIIHHYQRLGYHFHSITTDTARRDLRELMKKIIRMNELFTLESSEQPRPKRTCTMQ